MFLDAGAYDGGTAVQFARYCAECGKDYKRIVCFEPSTAFQKCQENVTGAGLHDCDVVNAGLYICNKEVSFDNSLVNGGSAAIVYNSGTNVREEWTSIRTVAIDDCTSCADVTFIKMDIEGAELDALMGAERTIRSNKPKLAICIYHKPEDVIKIPMYIESLRSDYKFFIRKYTPHHGEIVLYAV